MGMVAVMGWDDGGDGMGMMVVMGWGWQ